MSLLNSLLGNMKSDVAKTHISKAISAQGGLKQLVSKFEENGLGNVAQSWVSTGANLPITNTQIKEVLGSDVVKEIAGKIGISEDKIVTELAKFLPETVDEMTPSGDISEAA